MENPGNKFSVLNIQMSNIYFMKILIKKPILEKFRLRRAFPLLYFYCLFTWSEWCTAIQVYELPSQQSPLLFHLISFALLTLDGSSHLIGSNFKTNYSLEPLKTCPYYCVPYLWQIFVLILGLSWISKSCSDCLAHARTIGYGPKNPSGTHSWPIYSNK